MTTPHDPPTQGERPLASSLFAPPGTGSEARIRRFRTRVQLRAEASHDAASVLEHVLEAGCIAMPEHRHPGVVEVLHVLEGTLVVRLDADERTVPPGGSVVVPPSAWHTMWVPPGAPTPARFLAVFAPGGMERYYEEVASHVRTADARPDMAGVLGASMHHGVEVDMLSLYDLIERHGLSLA